MSSWFYVENDNRKGPVSDDDMKQLIATVQIVPDTLVWQDGMSDWVAASTQFGFPSTPPNMPPAYGAGAVGGASAGQQTGKDGLYVGAPSRGFGEAISLCFNKYVGFSGRASRSEFWYWILFTFVAGIVTGFMDMAIFGLENTVSPINSLFSLATFLPGLAVGFRRLHDIDRSGWWIGGYIIAMIVGSGIAIAAVAGNPNGDGPIVLFFLLGLAAFAYGIALIVFYCKAGDKGPNTYG